MEIWKGLIYQSKDYSDRFEVSNEGNIRNKLTGTVYKLQFIGNGYLGIVVSLGQKGKIKLIRAHKAVAETFIPNPNNLPQVNHKDGDKQNNKVENLEWVTNRENYDHAIKNNLITQQFKKGYTPKNKKLSDENRLYIKEHYIKGDKQYGQKALAKKFNVHRSIISNVITGYKTY